LSEPANIPARLAGIVEAHVPPGATVAVVSRGDNRLLDLPGRTAWHFPRAGQGGYAGYHPRDSNEALEELETVRTSGAEYLAVPRWSFWWLGFYQDWTRHLASRYRIVAVDESTAVLFALREREAQGVTPDVDRAAERLIALGLEPAIGRTSDDGPNPESRPDFRFPAEDERELDPDRLMYNRIGAKTWTDDLRVLVYAHVDANVIDGSSVWLVNVARMLGSRYRVDLLLRARIRNRHLLSELDDVPGVRIISPESYPVHLAAFGDRDSLSEYSAAELIGKLHLERNYRFVLSRGRQVNFYLSINPYVQSRLVAYCLAGTRPTGSCDLKDGLLETVVLNARVVVAQTPLLGDLLRERYGADPGRIVLLPPIVGKPVDGRAEFVNRGNRCLYAGKFDIEWRVADIIDACEQSHTLLRLAGNKFHDQRVDGEPLESFVMRKARSVRGIEFLGPVDHPRMPSLLDESDFGISLRSARHLGSVEFSTKVLELGARGKPSVVNDSPINRRVLGDGYPLFANSNDELLACLHKAREPDTYSRAARACHDAARRSFEAVATVPGEIERRLADVVVLRRAVVISGDGDALGRFPTDCPGGARTIRLACPREAGVRHDPMSRMLRWADVVLAEGVGKLDPGIGRLLDGCSERIVWGPGVGGPVPGEVSGNSRVHVDDLFGRRARVDVSVVIPSRDPSKAQLQRALGSVERQRGISGLSWEVIVVDDGSPHPLDSIVSDHYREHPNIHFVRNVRNRGLGMSRNIGAERARGAAVFFLDSDDYYSDEFIGAMCDELRAADVVLGRMEILDEEAGTVEERNYINDAAFALTTGGGDPTSVVRAVHACVKGYRREALERGRLYFGTGFHEDIYAWIRFLVENPALRVAHAPRATYVRTIRRGSEQITQNAGLTEARMMDLARARAMTADLLAHYNDGGRYDTLIRRFREMVAREGGPPGVTAVASPATRSA
jgi:glycosyltransferase involved in cell wall biosynthesis